MTFGFRRVRAAGFAVALLLGGHAAAEELRLPASLTLPAEARVAGEFIRLGDLVTDLEAGLGALVVGRAPVEDGLRAISREDVRTTLRRACPGDRLPALTGAQEVAVRRVAPVAPALSGPVVAALADAIRRWRVCADLAAGAECRIEVVDFEPADAFPGDLDLPPVVAGGDISADPWIVRVLAPAASGAPRAAQVRARVRLLAEVPVARRSLRARQAVAAGDLETRRMEILPGQRWLRADSDPVGRRLVRPLAAGEILVEDALQPETLVRPHDAVRVEVPGRGFALQFDAIALEAGASGDIIRVRNRDSKAVVRGRVLAPGAVELLPAVAEGGVR